MLTASHHSLMYGQMWEVVVVDWGIYWYHVIGVMLVESVEVEVDLCYCSWFAVIRWIDWTRVKVLLSSEGFDIEVVDN